MATKKQSPHTKAESAPQAKEKRVLFDASSFYASTMDVISKRQNFESSSLDVAPPMSTGLLQVDMVYGGGIRASMITAAADEQAGKTTLALATMASAIKENVPIIAFADYEGSTKNSKPYVQSILKTMGVNLTVDQVFGKRGSDGKWIVPPRVRYRAETILERFYDWLSEILRELPDKKYVEGKWWLVFDDKNKIHKAKVGEFVNTAMTRKYGNGLWVEAPDDKIQGLIFVDSYTAMQPKIKDEEEIGNQLSVKASAFSKQLERVKGRMAEKMVTVYGLNHLRDNPMAMFGPKQTEKGGKALQQFSDVRLRQTSRSLSAMKSFGPKADKDENYNESEMSVEYPGCKDVYRYVHISSVKNKLWTPNRVCFIRLWIRDGSGQARGIDPMFDTMAFLKDTAQVSGTRKAFKLTLEGLGTGKPLTWSQIKQWVLGDKETMTKISQAAGFNPMNLRAFCFKQIKSGVAEDLYVKVKNSKGSKDDESSDD